MEIYVLQQDLVLKGQTIIINNDKCQEKAISLHRKMMMKTLTVDL